MSNIFVIKTGSYRWLISLIKRFTTERWVLLLSLIMAIASSIYSFNQGYIVLYGDAESHLNIAKRVVDSLTPGFAQLGGIWLPLPHIFLIPFVYFDYLWRTGLAGSIVSGIAFIIATLFLYRLAFVLTKNESAAFVATLVFITNPNILYMQSTPMTELTLIVFFILSSYYFIRFLLEKGNIMMLILAALFGFCASLSRYDGWALVMMEAGVLFLYYLPFKFQKGWFGKNAKNKMIIPVNDKSLRERWWLAEGRLILFGSLAFFGILLWLSWGFLILGDPLYFTHSQFSANSQQMSWLARGELPAYHNVFVALLYYLATSVQTSGLITALSAIVGILFFTADTRIHHKKSILLILFVPFFFNVLTLFLGQSVIFLPGITPPSFEWTLFNVRYGSMMMPAIALFVGYVYFTQKTFGRAIILAFIAIQGLLFFVGFSSVLTLQDGISGLSSATAKMPDAQYWIASHYDYGKVLTDDYARTISIIRTPIPMKDVIYIGNKPYWEESFVEPQKYARWIIMQKNDAIWKNVYDRPEVNARLFKYFNKVYTSEHILIFRKIDE